MVDPAALTAFASRFRRPDSVTKRTHPGQYSGPEIPATWEHFGKVLQSVGGTLIMPSGNVKNAINAIEAAIDFGRVGSSPAGRILASAAAATHVTGIDGIEIATPTTTPADWENVDLAIITAELACAENAALLLSSATLPERALAFLAQRTLVLVPENALIGGFMQAQAQVAARFVGGEAMHHVTWMSGPSKTADIEQTLVIGAHGVCALAVLPLPIA